LLTAGRPAGIIDQTYNWLTRTQSTIEPQVQQKQEFESQKVKQELTQTETEEEAVRKRRAEGTPCNKENFHSWAKQFQKELDELREKEEQEDDKEINKKAKVLKKNEEEEMKGRLSGYEQFSLKLGSMNMDALERAAEAAANAEGDFDEDLFDEDLDDLDFDDEEGSDDDYDDSGDEEEEEELDI